MTKQELHLRIATLHYPPFIFHNQEKGSVYGFEPSLLQILAEQLNFTFQYVFASPNEMWGEIKDFGENNLTITGLLGMLHRGEADIALGDLYVDYNRKKYIDYTQPYGMVYECFMVPVPRPYPKWTALYEPFQWPVWVATFLSFAFAALTLRLAAKLRDAAPTYNDFFLCILFVLGHVLGMHQNHQGIRSTSNRFLFTVWLLCTFVIATIYRSELTSYMTSPYTPPPVDTIKQLVDSSLGKIEFGHFFRDSLLNSDIPLLKELGQQMEINYNFTYIISLMYSGTWAVQSSKENLEYEASNLYQVGNTENRIHLMLECILPSFNAFGLPKNSPLKQYFDHEIQKLLESGLIEYHRSQFVKKPTDNLKPASNEITNDMKPLSLNDLQGAFYLLLVGFFLSFICFIFERLIYRFLKLWHVCHNKKG